MSRRRFTDSAPALLLPCYNSYTMKEYDVIVVGAGPSGCSAAYTLAKAGAKVALLEKQKLPRHKTCGGGMPMTVAQTLQLDEMRDLVPEAFLEADVRYMRHTWNFGDPILSAMNPHLEPGDRKSVV